MDKDLTIFTDGGARYNPGPAAIGFLVKDEKGKRNLNMKGWPSVLFGEPELKPGYPTKKPEEVIKRLILNSSEEGDLILDPFAGSGIVGKVAVACKRKALLIDIDTTNLEDEIQEWPKMHIKIVS